MIPFRDGGTQLADRCGVKHANLMINAGATMLLADGESPPGAAKVALEEFAAIFMVEQLL